MAVQGRGDGRLTIRIPHTGFVELNALSWETEKIKYTGLLVLSNVGEAKGGIKNHFQDSSLGD